MSNWERIVAATATNVEERIDALRQRLGTWLGNEDSLLMLPFLGYGSLQRLFLQGRILDDEAVLKATAEDSVWDNLLNMYRRLESDEVAGARIRAHFQEQETETISDEEGFFEVSFQPNWVQEPDALWHQIELQLLAPLRDGHEPVSATGHVLIPPRQARFAVISDIDDTVMQTHATDLLRMARLTFLGNARTRLPFPGVAAFYRALQGGTGSQAQNPLFYISSSPWNLYDLLLDFLQLQNIPLGPLFLRDWGLTRTELLPTEHRQHKLQAICKLLDFYHELPFILIGDSGQQDPEIYDEVVRRYPGRILAVYIRDVSTDIARDEAIHRLQEAVAKEHRNLMLASDTLVMGRHAVEKGWIEPSMLDDIAAEVAHDKSQRTVVETLLDEEV